MEGAANDIRSEAAPDLVAVDLDRRLAGASPAGIVAAALETVGRERYGFRGELRATGQVLRDQFLFLLRAGFDSFEVAKEADVPHFVEAIKRYTVFYQSTGDRRETASQHRLAAAHAEGTR